MFKTFAKCFIIFSLLFTEVAYAFDFQKDVAIKFFWTESYKKAHPEPQNNMPKTMEEYYRAVNKAAAKNQNIPSPRFVRDEKLVDLPDPDLVVRRYNSPPGMYEINLNALKKKRQINSIGVASPEYDKMVYSTIFYYPSTQTTASELYLMQLDTSKGLRARLENVHVNNGKSTIYRAQMDELNLHIHRSLTVLDWSEDSQKIAFKEKIAYEPEGTWRTNLLVYDLTTAQTKDLSEVRSAIEYYWRKLDLNLKDYRWDIYPIGWDAMNPDRIIVFAYAATGEKPKYLGAWSIDYKGERSLLLSLTSTKFEVSQNGVCLKTVLKN